MSSPSHLKSLDERLKEIFPDGPCLVSSAPLASIIQSSPIDHQPSHSSTQGALSQSASKKTSSQKRRARLATFKANLKKAHQEAPDSSAVQEVVDHQALRKVKTLEKGARKFYFQYKFSDPKDSSLLTKAYDYMRRAHHLLPKSHPLYSSQSSYCTALFNISFA